MNEAGQKTSIKSIVKPNVLFRHADASRVGSQHRDVAGKHRRRFSQDHAVTSAQTDFPGNRPCYCKQSGFPLGEIDYNSCRSASPPSE